ncbi:hypothetical protein BN159_6659 [Streptomyces davaonensis JCM 4913]|uniref:Uncharacterized protein n=1 Tax=Streptomyces davaonensis (strain DSM 101723 / JCM 4913 / KCC S-0913 / 768) TaxID=1214101 RepID=K4RBW5_STRDJ|nr:hypothetical protein [Streptomyces davaonensis]CCK31038.1 hypothetical protein BN159_6659 [Streptomyces davaonensis JCM 4913]
MSIDDIEGTTEAAAAGDTEPSAIPIPFQRRSGVYGLELPRPTVPGTGGPSLLVLEELRVDVDGLMPTMTVSGTRTQLFGGQVTWIARVAWDAAQQGYTGTIFYRDGKTSLVPHTDVLVKLFGGFPFGGQRRARVTFTGGPAAVTRTFVFRRTAFREVGIEYDCASDATAVTDYRLHAHPNRPADLPDTHLTIESAFTRLGIAVTKTGGDDVVPVIKAGSDGLWTDIEMHDAMQVHWSKWADAPQWQVWTLFAGRSIRGHGLGGIMFDDIGTAQRQGCAVFSNSFISDPHPGDPDSDQAVQRLRFWTAVHEIGHTFNLAHSWDKDEMTRWIPLAEEPNAFSYMNYPFRFPAGEAAFWAGFRYGFSENELLFLRHAPERVVKQGAAPWFDEHAFEQIRQATSNALELSLRVNRPTTRFEALEPVVAEVKLKNTSFVPVVVDRNALLGERLTVIVSADGRDPRRWVPYARHCYLDDPYILKPGESLYAPLFLSAGLNGFDLAEPGRYRIHAMLDTASGEILSAPLGIDVRPPRSREEELLAPDVYTDEVGRVLAFGGSRGHAPALDRANDVLREAVERLPDSALAVHAAAALGNTAAVPGRILVQDSTDPRDREFKDVVPDPEQALPLIEKAYGNPVAAADTLGHIGLTRQVEQVAVALAAGGLGNPQEAARLTNDLADTLDARGVLPSVVESVRDTAAELSG